ncbi:MAG TPA: acyl-CoA dehydrogenase family protein [Dehalococcoidia bacterium]|nr:acyl-CoA dehydrogenase family protein [Dehalococcoidia bacterium]
MDFHDTPEQASFRATVKEFIDKELPDEFKRNPDAATRRPGAGPYGESVDAMKAWTKKLASRGWVAPAWPSEYGGAGLSVMEQFIFNEEMAMSRAPRPGGIGVGFAGPTIIAAGNEDQKKKYIPDILSGDVVWCQGFSEPGSGSDLASLQTKAVRDGDDYVVNGQKIWTSGAQFAQRMILLARTDPEAPKHKGISYFLLDMKSPGITIRPLINLAGLAGFNEVFFEDVRIPREDLLGEENRGWYIATTTLDFERSSIGSAVGVQQQVEDLIRYAKKYPDVSRLNDSPALRYELSDRRIEAEVSKMLSYRVVTLQDRGLIPNYESSITKLFSSELSQRINNTAIKVFGLSGQVMGGERAVRRGNYARGYMLTLASTIAGGTSEVQRNIIATRGLGLPRD